MKVTPLGDRILIKQTESEEKTKGGLFIPDTAKEKTTEGIVEAVGDSEDVKVKVKDRVIFDKYAGTTLKIDGEDRLILKMDDILAVVK